ncbi:hypothetical protein EVG20_g3700 [Dentipellis fragilis]|uniref:Uncharacterized protein n=1 Tax=Dentipellis fragilis TaxID=205917 RepID=A0A4Y9YZP9_9AGAM|nr:hypothetical protein EVG20_g3700 [Dentipellis fragilis]
MSNVFANHAIQKYGYPSDPGIRGQILHAFFVRVKGLHANWTGSVIKHPTETAEEKARSRSYQRKKADHDRRKEIAAKYPTLQKFVGVVDALGIAGMSSDESDSSEGQKRYMITQPAWRSAEIRKVMGTLDMVHSLTRASNAKRDTRGQHVRHRAQSERVSQRTLAPLQLPINFYDATWLQDQSVLWKKEVLQPRPEMDFNSGNEVLNIINTLAAQGDSIRKAEQSRKSRAASQLKAAAQSKAASQSSEPLIVTSYLRAIRNPRHTTLARIPESRAPSESTRPYDIRLEFLLGSQSASLQLETYDHHITSPPSGAPKRRERRMMRGRVATGRCEKETPRKRDCWQRPLRTPVQCVECAQADTPLRGAARRQPHGRWPTAIDKVPFIFAIARRASWEKKCQILDTFWAKRVEMGWDRHCATRSSAYAGDIVIDSALAPFNEPAGNRRRKWGARAGYIGNTQDRGNATRDEATAGLWSEGQAGEKVAVPVVHVWLRTLLVRIGLVLQVVSHGGRHGRVEQEAEGMARQALSKPEVHFILLVLFRLAHAVRLCRVAPATARSERIPATLCRRSPHVFRGVKASNYDDIKDFAHPDSPGPGDCDMRLKEEKPSTCMLSGIVHRRLVVGLDMHKASPSLETADVVTIFDMIIVASVSDTENIDDAQIHGFSGVQVILARSCSRSAARTEYRYRPGAQQRLRDSPSPVHQHVLPVHPSLRYQMLRHSHRLKRKGTLPLTTKCKGALDGVSDAHSRPTIMLIAVRSEKGSQTDGEQTPLECLLRLRPVAFYLQILWDRMTGAHPGNGMQASFFALPEHLQVCVMRVCEPHIRAIRSSRVQIV